MNRFAWRIAALAGLLFVPVLTPFVLVGAYVQGNVGVEPFRVLGRGVSALFSYAFSRY